MPLQIDATTRYATGNYTRPLTVSRAELVLAVQHADPQGPAADPDRQPWDGRRSRRPPIPRARSTCTSSSSRAATASSAFASSFQQFEKLAQQYQTARARRGGRSPTRCWTADDGRPHPPRGSRLAGRSQPLAGDAERRARRRRGLSGWRYQLLPVPPELFDETVRALPGAGFRGANVTIPHKQAALALADRATHARPGDRRREHAAVRRRRARSTRTTPTRRR